MREQVVHFIIASHQIVTPQDIIDRSGHFIQLLQYPEAPDTSYFLVQAKGDNLLKTPFLFYLFTLMIECSMFIIFLI